jgi:hypothetical protein
MALISPASILWAWSEDTRAPILIKAGSEPMMLKPTQESFGLDSALVNIFVHLTSHITIQTASMPGFFT